MLTKMMLASQVYYSGKTAYVTVEEHEYRLAFNDSVYSGTSMTTAEARNLAKNLYRLAARVDKRNSSKVTADDVVKP